MSTFDLFQAMERTAWPIVVTSYNGETLDSTPVDKGDYLPVPGRGCIGCATRARVPATPEPREWIAVRGALTRPQAVSRRIRGQYVCLADRPNPGAAVGLRTAPHHLAVGSPPRSIGSSPIEPGKTGRLAGLDRIGIDEIEIAHRRGTAI